MGYFYEPNNDIYMTSGIAENVDSYLLVKCIELLNCLKEKGVNPDYLQVYRVSYNKETNVLTIRHTQEQPDYENVVSFELPSGVLPYTGKIYYMDEYTHLIFLEANEY